MVICLVRSLRVLGQAGAKKNESRQYHPPFPPIKDAHSVTKQIIKIVLRVLTVILIGFVSAVIGFIAGAIIGWNLAGIYELVTSYEVVFNGRVGYEASGQIGFILGTLTGLVGSGVVIFGRRTKKTIP
jgi:hypothetical protein